MKKAADSTTGPITSWRMVAGERLGKAPTPLEQFGPGPAPARVQCSLPCKALTQHVMKQDQQPNFIITTSLSYPGTTKDKLFA